MKNRTNYKSLNNTKVRKSKRKLAFFGIFGLAIIFVGVVVALNIFKAKPHDSTDHNNYTELSNTDLAQNKFSYKIEKDDLKYSSSEIDSNASSYAIITGVKPEALPAGFDGFNVKFPEVIVDNGKSYPVKEIDCTIDTNGTVLPLYRGYKISSFDYTRIIDGNATFVNSIRRIEVPECVEYIEVGSFHGVEELREIKLPFIGVKRGNKSTTLYDTSTDGYKSAFLAIFGTGERVNGRQNTGMFYQNDNYRPAYYTDSKSINENPTLTDGGSGTVSWYDADLTILTDLYLPYYLEHIEITDEVYVATHAFFNVARAKEIKITFSTASWVKKFTMNKSIGNYAFARCIKLITAELPSTATTIGTGAFSQCYYLGKQDPDNNINGYVKLPNVLAEIPEACFNFCTNLAEITLPYKVSKIGKQAFFDCESLKKINSAYDESGSVNKQTSNTITLPETITIIGEEAFRYCQRFEIVVIPNNVQEIGNSALNGCKNLKDLTLPFIGSKKGNSGTADSLFGFIFGDFNDSSPDEASSDPTVFQTDNGDPNETSTDKRHAFYIPESLVNVSILNESVVTPGAFMNCSHIQSLNIQSSAAEGTQDTTMTIGQGALYGCTSLNNLTIPFTGKSDSIGGEEGNFGWIFGSNSYGNNETSAVEKSSHTGYWYIPNSLKTVKLQHQTTLKSWSFYKTTMIQNLVISKALQQTERNVFYDCVSLETLEMPFVGAQRGAETAYHYWDYDTNIMNSMIYLFAFMGRDVTGHYENAWVTDWQGSRWNSSIPETLTSITITDDTYIAGYAFRGFKGLKKITILNDTKSLSYIDEGVFAGCESLETLEIPFIGSDANTNRHDKYNYTIGFLFGRSAYGTSYRVTQSGYSFYIPKQLSSIKINSAVNYVPAWSFANMSSLNSVEIVGKIDTIGAACFYNDIHLKDLTMKDACYINVANYAFANCATLGEMERFIPGTVKTIGNYAFMGTSISKISDNIVGLLTSIGNYAFSNCNQLQSFDFNDITSVTSFGEGVFSGCKRLVSVTNIKFLTPYMFKDCSSLEGVNLDYYFNLIDNTQSTQNVTKVDYIPEGLFAGCVSLKSPGIPGGLELDNASHTITTIGAYAFKNCESLTTLILPESLTEIQTGAFQNCNKLEKMRIVRSCYIIPAGTDKAHNTDLTDLGVFYGCNEDFYLEVYNPEALWPTTWGYNWNCYFPVYVIGDNTSNIFTYEYSDDVKGYLITGFNTDDNDFYVQLNSTYDQYLLEDTVIFPSSYNGLPVKGIVEGAFNHFGPDGNEIDPGIDYFAKVNTFVLGENFTEIGDGLFSYEDRTVYIYSQKTIAQAQKITAPQSSTFVPSTIGGKSYNTLYQKYRGISYGIEGNYASRAMIFYKDSWRFVGTKPTILMDAINFILEDDSFVYNFGRKIEPVIKSLEPKDGVIVYTNMESIRENGGDLIYNIFYTYDKNSYGYDTETITGLDNVYIKYSNNVNVGTGRITFTSNTSMLYGTQIKTFDILKYELQLFHSSSDNAEGATYVNYANDFVRYYKDKVTNSRFTTNGVNGKYSTVIQKMYGSPWTVSNWTQGGSVLNLPTGYSIIGTLTTSSSNAGDYIACKQDISGKVDGAGTFKWIGSPIVTDSLGNNVTSNFSLVITAYVEILPYKIDSSSTGNLKWDGTLKDDGLYHYKYTGQAIVPSAYVYDDKLGNLDAGFVITTNEEAIEPNTLPGYNKIYTATIKSCSPNFKFDGNQNPQIQFVIDKGEITIEMNVNYTLKDDDDYYRYSGGFSSWKNSDEFNMTVKGCGTNSVIYGDLITSDCIKGTYSSAYDSANPGNFKGSFGWDSSKPLKIVSTTRHNGADTDPFLVEYDSANTNPNDNRYDVILNIQCTISYINFDYALTVNEYIPEKDVTTGTTSWNEKVLHLDDSLQVLMRNFTDSTMNSVDKLTLTYGVDGYEHSLGVDFRNVFANNTTADVKFEVVGGAITNLVYKFKEIPTPIPTVSLNLTITKKNYEPVYKQIELTLGKGNFNFSNPLDKEYDRKPVNGLDALLRRPSDLDSCNVTFLWFDGYTNEQLSTAPSAIGYYKVNIIATGSQYFNDFTTNNEFYFTISRRRIIIKVVDTEDPYDSKLYDGKPWTYNPVNATVGINGESLNLLEGDKLTGSFTSRSEAVGLYRSKDESGNATKDFFEKMRTTVNNDTLGEQSNNYVVVFEGNYEIKPRQFKYEINVDNSYANQDSNGVYTFTYNGNYHRATVTVSEPTSNYQIYYSLQNPMAGAVEVEWSIYPFYFNQPSDGTNVYTTYVKLVADTYETVYDQVAIKIDGLTVDVVPNQLDFTYDGFSHSIILNTNPYWATLYYYDFTGFDYNKLDPDSFEWSTIPPTHTEIGSYNIAVRAIANNYNTFDNFFKMNIIDNGPTINLSVVGDNVNYDREQHGITIKDIASPLKLSDLVIKVALKDSNYLNDPQWINVQFNETAPASGIYKANFLSDAGTYPLYIEIYSKGYKPLKLGSSPDDTVTVNINKLEFEFAKFDFYNGIFDGNYHTGLLKLEQNSSDRLIVTGSVNDNNISYKYAKVVDNIEEIFDLTVYYGTLVNGQPVYTTEIQRFKNVTNTPLYIKVTANNFNDCEQSGSIIISKGDINIQYSNPQEIQYLARPVQDGDFDIITCHDGARVYKFKEYVTNSTGALELSNYYITNPTNLGKYYAYVSFADTQNCNAAEIKFDFEIKSRILTVEYDHELEYTGGPQMPHPNITTGTRDTVYYDAVMHDINNPSVIPDMPTLPGTYYFKLNEIYHNENYELSDEYEGVLEFKIINRKVYISYDGTLDYTGQKQSIYANYISSNAQEDSDSNFHLKNILSVDSLSMKLTTLSHKRGEYHLNAIYSYDANQDKYVLKDNSTSPFSFSFDVDSLKVYKTSSGESNGATAPYYDIIVDIKLKIVAPQLEVTYDSTQTVIFDGKRHHIDFNITSPTTGTEIYEYWYGQTDNPNPEDISDQNFLIRNVGHYIINFRITSLNYETFVGRVDFTILQGNLQCAIDDYSGVYDGTTQQTTYQVLNMDVADLINDKPTLYYFKKSILASHSPKEITLDDIEKFFMKNAPANDEIYQFIANGNGSSMLDAGEYYAVLYYPYSPTNNIGRVYEVKEITIEQRTLWFNYNGSDPFIKSKNYDGQKYSGIKFVNEPNWTCEYDTTPTSNNLLVNAGLVNGHQIDFTQFSSYTFRTVSANARGNADGENNGDPYQAEGDFEFEHFIISLAGVQYQDNYRPAFNKVTDVNGDKIYPFQITIKRIDLNKFDVFDTTLEYSGNQIFPKVKTPSDGELEAFYYKTDSNFNILPNDSGRYYQQTDVGYYLVYVHIKMGTNYYEWKYPQNPDPNYDFLDSDGKAYRIAHVQVTPKKIKVDWGTTTITYDGDGHEATPSIKDVYGNKVLISYSIYDNTYTEVPHETVMTNAGYYYLHADLSATSISNANNYDVQNSIEVFTIEKREYTISYQTNEPWLKDYWYKDYTENDFDDFIDGFKLDLKIRTISQEAGIYQYANQFVIDATVTDRDGYTYYDHGINVFENKPIYVKDNFQFNLNFYVVLDSKTIKVRTNDIDREYNNQDVYPQIDVISHTSGYSILYYGIKLNDDGSLPNGFDENSIAYAATIPYYRNVGKYKIYYKVNANGDEGVENTAFGSTTITIRQATAYINVGNIDKTYDGNAIASIPVSGGFNGDYSSSGTLIQTNNRNKLLNFEFKRDGESDASYNSDFHPINAGTYWVRITSKADNNSSYMQNYTALDTIENTFKFTIKPATLIFTVADDKEITSESNISYNTNEQIIRNNSTITANSHFGISGLLASDYFTYKIYSNVGTTLRRTTYLYTDAIARGDTLYTFYGTNNDYFSIEWKTTTSNGITSVDNFQNYNLKLVFSLCIHFPRMTVDEVQDVTVAYDGSAKSFATESNILNYIHNPNTGYNIKYSTTLSSNPNDYNLDDISRTTPGTTTVFFMISCANFEDYFGQAKFTITYKDRNIKVADGALDKYYDAVAYDSNSWQNLLNLVTSTDRDEALPTTGWKITYFLAEKDKTDDSEWKIVSDELTSVVNARDYIFRLTIPASVLYGETVIQKHFQIKRITYTVSASQVVETTYTGSRWIYNLGEALLNNNSIFTVTGLLNQDGNGNPVGHHITSAMLVNDNIYSGKYVQNNNDPNNSGSIDISDQYSYTIVDQDGVDVRINYEYNLDFALIVKKGSITFTSNIPASGIFAYDKDGISPIVSAIPAGYKVEYSEAQNGDYSEIPFTKYNVGTYSFWARCINVPNYDDAYQEFTYTIEKQPNTLIIDPLDKVYDGSQVNPVITTNDYHGTASSALGQGFNVIVKYYDENEQNETANAPKNVGTYWVSVIFGSTTNYTGLEVKQKFTISPRELTVNVDKNILTYNAKEQEPNYTITSNIVVNLNLGVDYTIKYYTQSDLQTAITKPKNIGSYSMLISLTGTGENSTFNNFQFDNGQKEIRINYEITKAKVTFTVSEAHFPYTNSPITISLSYITTSGLPQGVTLDSYIISLTGNSGTYNINCPYTSSDFTNYFKWSSTDNKPILTYNQQTESLDNYDITMVMAIIVAVGDLPYAVTEYVGQYDGQAHTINFQISQLSNDMTVLYSKDNSQWFDSLPTETNVTNGAVHIYVKVTSSLYNNGQPVILGLPGSTDYNKFTITITKADLTIEQPNVDLNKVYDGKVTTPPTATEIHTSAFGTDLLNPKYHFWALDKTDVSGNNYHEVPVIETSEVGKYYLVIEYKDNQNYTDAQTQPIYYEITPRQILVTMDDKSKTYDSLPWEGTISNDPSAIGALVDGRITTVPGIVESGLVSGHYFNATIKTKSANSGTYTLENDFIYKSSYRIYDYVNNKEINIENYKVVLKLNVLISNANFWLDENNFIIKFTDGHGIYDGVTEYFVSHSWTNLNGDTTYPLITIPDGTSVSDLLKIYDSLISYNEIGFNVSDSEWLPTPIGKKFGTTTIYIKVAAPNYNTYYTQAQIIVDAIPSGIIIDDRGILASDKVYNGLPYEYNTIVVRSDKPNDTRVPYFKFYYRNADGTKGNEVLDINGQNVAPTNAGNYILRVYLDADQNNGYADYESDNIPFNVIKAKVPVYWGADHIVTSTVNGNVTYKYEMYYTGSEKIPLARAYGIIDISANPSVHQYELIPLTVTADRTAISIGSYIATAAISSADYKQNYELLNPTTGYEIVKSVLLDPNNPITNPVFPNDPSDPSLPDSPNNKNHPNSPNNPNNNSALEGIEFLANQYNPKAQTASTPFTYGEQIILEVKFIYSDRNPVVYYYYVNKSTNARTNNSSVWTITSIYDSNFSLISTNPNCEFEFEFPATLTTPTFDVTAKLKDKNNYAWNTNGDIADRNIIVHMDPLDLNPNNPDDPTNPDIWVEKPTKSTLLYDGTPLEFDQTDSLEKINVWYNINHTPNTSDDVLISPDNYTVYYGNNINPTSDDNNPYNNAYVIIVSNSGYVLSFKFGDYDAYNTEKQTHANDPLYVNKNINETIAQTAAFTFEIVSPEPKYITLTEDSVMKFVSYEQDFDPNNQYALTYTYGISSEDRNTALEQIVGSETNESVIIEKKKYSMFKLSHIAQRHNLKYILTQIKNDLTRIAVYKEDGTSLWDGALDTTLSDSNEMSDWIGSGTYIVLYDCSDISTRKAVDAVEIVIVGDVNGDGMVNASDSADILQYVFAGYDSSNQIEFQKAKYVAGLVQTTSRSIQSASDSAEVLAYTFTYTDTYDYFEDNFYSYYINQNNSGS